MDEKQCWSKSDAAFCVIWFGTRAYLCLFYLDFTSLSTVFQSYSDGVWVWHWAKCSLLECCFTEISHPRYMRWYSICHIILTAGWQVLIPSSTFLLLNAKRAASTIFKFLVWLGQGSNQQPPITKWMLLQLSHCAGSSDATFCGINSGSTLFAQAYLSQYFR